MLSSSLQTSPLSLFSSTSSVPFALFSHCCDSDSLPEDAGIVLLHDDSNEIKQIIQADDQFQQREDKGKRGVCLDEVVALVQSPNIQATYIQCPPSLSSSYDTLGIKLSNVHFQLCSLGSTRHFFLEVGVRDQRGVKARIRCSTFQTKAKIYLPITDDNGGNEIGPLLHLPLVLPVRNDHTVTKWMTLSLPLASLMAHFSDASLLKDSEQGGPTAARPSKQFNEVDYVRVHANCRLRRIWFTSHPQDPSAAFPLIFQRPQIPQ